MKNYNLIFLRSEKVLLSTKPYNDWREIQDAYEDYMTSIEFKSLEEVQEYLMIEYKLTFERVKGEISRYEQYSDETIELEL